jgi:hypothetical protein
MKRIISRVQENIADQKHARQLAKSFKRHCRAYCSSSLEELDVTVHTFYDFLESVFGQAMLLQLLPELVQLLPEASHRAKLLLRAGMLLDSNAAGDDFFTPAPTAGPPGAAAGAPAWRRTRIRF